jgi:XTP/dITP diphosphohydrolase
VAAVVGPIRATVCTGNPHKLEEFRALFPDWELELLAGADFPPEDGVTFADNALIKARYGRRIGARGGGPGVQTARWAEGRHVEKLLAALEGRDDRDARYVCELVAIGPDGAEARGTGVLEGTIALAPAGDQGFGFDPIFIPLGETRTVAELGDEWKALYSHRALAARALRDTLS